MRCPDWKTRHCESSVENSVLPSKKAEANPVAVRSGSTNEISPDAIGQNGSKVSPVLNLNVGNALIVIKQQSATDARLHKHI